jgi:hypothetical protein
MIVIGIVIDFYLFLFFLLMYNKNVLMINLGECNAIPITTKYFNN